MMHRVQFTNPGGLMGGLKPEDLNIDKVDYYTEKASSPNVDRLSTLSPREYTGQAGFRTVQTMKVRRRKEGSAGIMFVDDSCFRRRSEDLSACLPPDNVWVQELELKDFPDLQFAVEPLKGFMRSELKVSMQGMLQDTAQDTALVKDLLIHLEGEMSREEIQQKLKLTHRENFRKFYLKPSLEAELIKMTLPDKPNSKYQKYMLTEKGKKMREQLIETGSNEK